MAKKITNPDTCAKNYLSLKEPVTYAWLPLPPSHARLIYISFWLLLHLQTADQKDLRQTLTTRFYDMTHPTVFFDTLPFLTSFANRFAQFSPPI